MRNQFALYRVNPLTSGKVLWHKTFEEVREMGIPVRIELYRPYHLELLEKEEPVMEIWKQIENSAESVMCWYSIKKGKYPAFISILIIPGGLRGSCRSRHPEQSSHWIREIMRLKDIRENGQRQMISS